MRPPMAVVLRGHSARIHAFAFSPDGWYVATASADTTDKLWKTSDGSCVETLTEHTASVTHAVISADSDGRFWCRVRRMGRYVCAKCRTLFLRKMMLW
ncbi:hypothetical protein C8Q80DRAFT_846698 [Daedaleopsis nitida]|nr:hypothetical protein C8Q80DRAFT_846698 [Daedaleopsis nitida]